MQKAALAPLFVLVALIAHEFLRTKAPHEVRPKLPKLHVIGTKKGEWFSRLRAMWRNTMDVRTAIAEAYEFKDQACILPIIDLGSAVIVPPSEVPWYLDQPETELSIHDHHMDAFQLNWTLTDPRIVADAKPIHHSLISTKLTREINNLLPSMADEITGGIDDAWGTDAENSRELCPMDDMPAIISRVVNRAFVGTPTCYNKTLNANGIGFAQGLGFAAIVVRCMPQMLHPILAPLLTLPTRIATWRFFGALRPEVNRRLDEIRADPKAATKYNDFLQWTIDAAIKSGDPYMMKADTIMGRVLFLNFVSIHTSTFAITHVLFDLASNSPDYIEELRAEIAATLEAHGGEWNKKTLGDMPKLDSVFAESQRLNPVATMASPKPVSNPNGVTMPSGLHLRYGTYMATLSYPILHDPTLYPDPETFHPFRFAERAEEAEKQGLKIEKASQAWTSVTKTYTAFGMGKHACPGRFFASNTLKITLAYVLMNYDLEKLPERPANFTFGFGLLPPFKGKIRFKRRKESVYG